MDRREVTIEVVNEKLASEATWRSLEEFGSAMRDVMVGKDESFDGARWSLRENFGLAVTATRTVFEKS